MKLTYPHIGKYTKPCADFLRELGIDVLEPRKIDRKTIELGVKNSPEMMCLPYKITLGTLMQALDDGATDILHANSRGDCRFRCYYDMQRKKLRELGYKFNMHVVDGFVISPWKIAKKLNPKLSFIKFIKTAKKYVKIIKKIDEDKGKGDIKIAIVGEIYTIIEGGSSMDVEEKLKKQGCEVDLSLSVTNYLNDLISRKLLRDNKKKEKKEAKKYFGEHIGGHGFHTVYNTLHYCKKGYDGIVNVLPIFCMPENTVENVVQKIANKHDVPLLTLRFDENNSPTIIDTQLETFVEMIRRKKRLK
jgi:predicted nucleotide-binding protein (sugar kinase/HSP70/actin superfamily)